MRVEQTIFEREGRGDSQLIRIAPINACIL